MNIKNIFYSIIVTFNLLLLPIQAMSNSYEYILSNGVKIKLETALGVSITTLLHNNGGLYVCDFIRIQIILPDELNALFNSESKQSQAMFLYQLVLEKMKFSFLKITTFL